MAAAEKIDFENKIKAPVNKAAGAVDVIGEAGVSNEVIDSPALALQQRVEDELNKKSFQSRRDGSAALLVVCLATWVAGFLLYATL